MTLPRTVVVATDFSEQAEKATRYALELAQRLEAKVELVHAWQIPVVTSPELAMPLPVTFVDDLARDSQRAMDEAVKRHSTTGVPVHGTVVCGDARDAVLETLDKVKGELLVLGTHGRRGLKRALLGSVAENVVRFSPCPVLVVR